MPPHRYYSSEGLTISITLCRKKSTERIWKVNIEMVISIAYILLLTDEEVLEVIVCRVDELDFIMSK